MTTAQTIVRRQFDEADKMLFTRGNVATVLGIRTTEIEAVYPVSGGVQVELKDWSMHFVSTAQAGHAFVAKRQARAKSLGVTQHIDSGSKFTVLNETQSTRYQVQMKRDRVTCTCEDWSNQHSAFQGRACCKHAYATLNHMGYSSLEDWVKANKAGGKFDKMKTWMLNGCPDRHLPKSEDYSAVQYEAAL